MTSEVTELMLELERTKSAVERVLVRQDAHEKSDDERYNQIRDNSKQTLEMITDLGRKIENGFTRAHEMREEGEGNLRHKINNEVTALNARISQADNSLTTLQIQTLVAGCVFLLSIVGFFVIPFFTKGG